MAKTPPTEGQLKVLQWIADGSPAGVFADPKFKVSADALDRRNLVRVKRRRNPWIAEITDEGKELLARGRAGANVESGTHASAPSTAHAPDTSTTSRQPAPTLGKEPISPVKSATQEMVDRLVVEHIIEFTHAETRRYQQLVAVARRKKLLPDDMEIVVSTSWSKPCSVELRRRPEWQLMALDPVHVPALIRTPHAVIAKLKQQRTDRLGMDKPRWNWALRVIQGLVLEAERRRYRVEAPSAPKPDSYGYVSREMRAIGHLLVGIGEDEVNLHFSQSTKLVPRLLTAAELRRQEKGFRVSTEELVKTDFLTIRLSGLEPAFWQSEWTETESAGADSLLPRILQEVELRAARAGEQRLERQRREDEKRHQWEVVRQQATRRLNEDHRAKVLLEQAERFHQVQLLNEYIAAVKRHVRSMTPVDASAANAWLQWAESHAKSIDPLLGELRIPDDPKPDAEAIKPYMNGLSPYGPDRWTWG